MFKLLKKLWHGRQETDEEQEFRKRAHRGILASTAGLSGVGKIEEEDGDSKICDDSDAGR
jgi:hypothetical protein